MEKTIPLSRLKIRWLQSKDLLVTLFTIICLMSSNIYGQTPIHELLPVSPSNNVYPWGAGTAQARTQWLYLPSEFTPPPTVGLITKVYFKVWTTSRAATTYTDLEVLIGTTAQTGLTTTYVTGMQLCYTAPTTNFPAQVQNDWMEITLQTPFLWNAADNLVVEVRQQGYTVATNVWNNSGMSTYSRVYGSSAVPLSPTETGKGTNHAQIGIDMMPATPCSGQVVAGTAMASETDACGNVPFSLSLNGNTNATGVTYQWQSSPAGTGTFTDISGATTAYYIVNNQTAATDYRCVVVCTNSNTTATSTVVSVGQNPFTECYCVPVYTTGCATYNLNSFVIIGEGTSEISDLNTSCNN